MINKNKIEKISKLSLLHFNNTRTRSSDTSTPIKIRDKTLLTKNRVSNKIVLFSYFFFEKIKLN